MLLYRRRCHQHSLDDADRGDDGAPLYVLRDAESSVEIINFLSKYLASSTAAPHSSVSVSQYLSVTVSKMTYQRRRQRPTGIEPTSSINHYLGSIIRWVTQVGSDTAVE